MQGLQYLCIFLNDVSRNVRIPFSIDNPAFLLNVASNLGSLNINGRDMSMKFPESFNKAVEGRISYFRRYNQWRIQDLTLRGVRDFDTVGGMIELFNVGLYVIFSMFLVLYLRKKLREYSIWGIKKS